MILRLHYIHIESYSHYFSNVLLNFVFRLTKGALLVKLIFHELDKFIIDR